MEQSITLVLTALAYLMVKHWLADFVFQTERQRDEKGIYGRLGGITHAATHIALTAPVFLILPPPSVAIALAILAGEFIVHYHIDWAKEVYVRRLGLTTNDTLFWWAMGFDQLLHGLTYVAIIAVLTAPSA